MDRQTLVDRVSLRESWRPCVFTVDDNQRLNNSTSSSVSDSHKHAFRSLLYCQE